MKSWRSADQERALKAGVQVKFHNPAADMLLGAMFEGDQKIGDVVCDLADNGTTPGERPLPLIEMSLPMHAACYFRDDVDN